MSMSFGKKSSESSTKQDQDPWDIATPYIQDFLGNVGSQINKPGRMSRDAKYGTQLLENNAREGNPYASEIDRVARDLMGTESYAPMVGEAYGDFKTRLTPIADGQNLNIDNNPYFQQMLQKASDDARGSVNDLFAGAGRSFSGIHQGALGEGITDATGRLMFDQYGQEQGRTDAAIRDLFQGGNTAATSMANLDAMRAQLQQMGVGVTDKALEARDYTGTRLAEIDALRNELKSQNPEMERLKQLAAILFPAGQLGQQQTGRSEQDQTSIGGNIKFL